MTPHAQRLALGTAQLGQRYGVANRTGQPDRAEARAILETARSARIDTIDTAIGYGDSENVLGAVGVEGFRVVTKLKPLATVPGGDVSGHVRREVLASLHRLRVSRVHGLLLHRPADALGPYGIELVATLRGLRSEGLVEKIGVSIYDPSELDALDAAMDFEIVQAPYNVFDRRLEESGWLARLANRGVETHTRSAFLQGLLLLDPADQPPRFAAWRGYWSTWRDWLAQERLTPLAAALGFVLRNASITRVVVGVDTTEQLQAIAEAPCALGIEPPASLACADLDLIDPSRWTIA